jgi:NADH-quinone oxidoreductase subunit G
MNFYLDEPNGSLKGGDPGIRLIETSDKNHLSFFDPVAKPFKIKPGEWLIIPGYRIFGSEELSSKSRSVAKRIGDLSVNMNYSDAEQIGGKDNDFVVLTMSDKTLDVKLKIENSIPAGIAILSVGLPGMPYLDLPEWGKLTIKKS